MNLVRIYNRISGVYDILDYPFERLLYRPIRLDLLSDLRDLDILEIGVGTGKNLPLYHPSNRVMGVDISQNMIERASNRLSRPNMSFRLIDGVNLPFEDNSFDAIVASFVIYLQQQPRQLIDEMSRVLREDGKLVVIEYRRPNTLFYYVVAKWLSTVTNPLYGLDFETIHTLNWLDPLFRVIYYKEYVNQWLYGAILVSR